MQVLEEWGRHSRAAVLVDLLELLLLLLLLLYLIMVSADARHGATPNIGVDVHHVVIDVTVDFLLVHIWGVLVLPAASTGDRKVVHLAARVVLTRRQDISHAGMVVLGIELAQLGYLTFVLLTFVELEVLSGRVDVFLQGLPLLRLWRVGILHLVTPRHEPVLVFGMVLGWGLGQVA